MPREKDFKRLVRARMSDTGERYTQARTALVAERDVPDPVVSDRTRSLLGQLADVQLAALSRDHLARLPEPEFRAAAVEGLAHENWRVRRTCALLLDKVDLTAESVAALTRALDDVHQQVRRKAVHALGCEHCKPNGCVPGVRPAFERAIRDPSALVRGMVVHVCSLQLFDRQWAIDLVAGVAASDKSAKLRDGAADAIRQLRGQWASDDMRRELDPELVRKTERHPGRWVAIRDGRIVGVDQVPAGARSYWVAPPGAARPRLPS